MSNSLAEDLGHYVRRIMKMKRLTLRDIEIRSEGRITDGYVSGIISGVAKNPSVEKVLALATGLGVGPEELFYAACGLPGRLRGSANPVDLAYAENAVELMHKILINPDLMLVVQEAANLPPTERGLALRAMKRLNNPKVRARRTRGSG